MSAAPETFKTSTGIQIAYDRYSSGAKHLVILSHGIFGSKDLEEIHFLASHLQTKFDVIALDCRGHGQSSGRFSFGLHEWRDLGELAHAQRPHYEKIVGIGFSFGAFHTCIATARTHCFDAAMLVSGPKDFWILDHNPLNGFKENFLFMQRRKHRSARLGFYPAMGRRIMPIRCIGDIKVPVHVVHGDKDWLIHHKHAVALHEHATEPKELTILEGGVHAEYLLRQMPDRFIALIEGWLARVL